MKIPDNIGKHFWSQYLFNPDTLQIAYGKSMMKPTDHGYVKGMEAYMDYENDKCIVRHFDNALVTLRLKGFRYIVADEHKDDKEYNRNDSIFVSEMLKLIDEKHQAQPKIYVNNKYQEKKEVLMSSTINVARKLQGTTDENLAAVIFELTSLIRKNFFTQEELQSKINENES